MDETEVIYGIIGTVPMGEYDPDVKYELLNLVSYDGSSYVAHTDPPVGTLPTDTDYWQVSAQGTSKATESTPGTVMPDGVTTEVDSNGALSVKTATNDTRGLVKGSQSIRVASNGGIYINTDFTQTTELEYLIKNELFEMMLGKISKAIAVTMNLDHNALLKNMLTNMDTNDQNKVPTAALVHTLVERIGMGEDLDIGTSLTDAVNKTNSNLTNVTSGLDGIKSKTPSDLAYITSFIPRIHEFNSNAGGALLNDITYMINEKGILTGSFGYANVVYADKPVGVADYGYVEYFKHADDYVTVKVYPENALDFYVGRFILNQSTWHMPWQKVKISE